jgi:aromatic ring hydroxylase
MKNQTAGGCMESLRKIRPTVFHEGKKTENVTWHPATASLVRAAAMTV